MMDKLTPKETSKGAEEIVLTQISKTLLRLLMQFLIM
tara:strand:- start:618 stop:728 length:111 start_codon:yes stop_codon:yes gene_type:complete